MPEVIPLFSRSFIRACCQKGSWGKILKDDFCIPQEQPVFTDKAQFLFKLVFPVLELSAFSFKVVYFFFFQRLQQGIELFLPVGIFLVQVCFFLLKDLDSQKIFPLSGLSPIFSLRSLFSIRSLSLSFLRASLSSEGSPRSSSFSQKINSVLAKSETLLFPRIRS